MINIGLDENARSQVAQRLNVLLSNEYVLYTKTLKYHWNVVGELFGPLHGLFREQYEQLFDVIDHVAERVRSLGFKSFGTLQEFMEYSSITQQPANNPDAKGMIKDLLGGYEIIIKQLRADINLTAELNDMGTNNFLSDLIERHEKTAWMLRAHLC